MKRFLTITVAVLMSALPTSVLALAGGPTLVAQSSAASVAVNGQFTVTVQMDTKTYQVTAAELRMTYPADTLQVLSAAAGTFLPSVLTEEAFGSGAASITVGSGTTPKQGTGPVMTITFKALVAGTAQIAFAGTTRVAAVGQASNTVDTMSPVSVTIGGAQATATSQAQASPASIIFPSAASVTPVASATVVAAGTTRTPTPRPSGAAQTVSRVSTGPVETTLIAIILGSIGTLLYVGYMGSDAFRRGEAQSIATQERRHESDFRDTL